MVIKILIGVAVVIGILLVVIAMRPAEFRVVRTAAIAAPASIVFPNVNDLHKWEAWSPWAKMDPNAKSTFEGPHAGPGASMSWAGNNKVGEGRMTITESRLNELVRLRLDFIKPMENTHTAQFDFDPDGDQTVVTWRMSGKNNFVGKAFAFFVNCDKMIGGNFEQGLASMKTVCETAIRQQPTP